MASDRKKIEEAADLMREIPVEYMASAMRIYKLGVQAGKNHSACPSCPHCIASGEFGVLDPRDTALTTNKPERAAMRAERGRK